jgi:hypothetical protein
VDWQRFFRQASRFDPHLKHLREACDYAAYNTGNVWLDTTEEMLGYSELPDWDRETIDWLAAEWRKARIILRHVNEPVDWLEEDPQRLASLIRLWNRCVQHKEASTDEPHPNGQP